MMRHLAPRSGTVRYARRAVQAGLIGTIVLLVVISSLPSVGTPTTRSGVRTVSQAGAVRSSRTVTPRGNGAVTAADWIVDPNPGGPGGLFDPSLAADPANGQVLLFGGCTGVECSTPSNQTWLFQNGTWSQLTPSVFPPGREYGSMVYDTADGYFLLYGGQGKSGYLNDTWTFAHGAWTQLTEPTNPGIRSQASMAYDTALNEAILFGGTEYSTSNQTWAFQSGAWKNLSLATGPPDRSEAVMAYDAAAQAVVLYSGLSSEGAYLADTWEFTSGGWTELSISAPPLRDSAVMAYDPVLGQMIMSGGDYVTSNNFPGVTYTDTWAFASGQWEELAPNHAPPGGSDGAAVYDSQSQAVVAVGGCTASACPNALTYEFAIPIPLTVTFQPDRCGPITLGSDSFTNGSSENLPAGQFEIRAPACKNYTFEQWSVIGSAVLSNATISAPILNLSGSAAVEAFYLANQSSTQPPGGGGPSPVAGAGLGSYEILAALGVVIALVAALAVWIVRRRRSPPSGASPPPAQEAPMAPAGPPAGPPVDDEIYGADRTLPPRLIRQP